jgi:hypothetical protein
LSRSGGKFAVLIGAFLGVAAALLARRGQEPPASMPSTSEKPLGAAPPTAEPVPAAPLPSPVPASVQASALGSAAAADASALAPATSLSTPLAVPEPPATLEELKAIEVRCYAQDPVACRRASLAYEAGKLLPRDTDRAQNYRKVELTQLVRKCEKRQPLACVRLAELYAAGDVVGPNARKAEQLRAHARDLCTRRASDDCSALFGR